MAALNQGEGGRAARRSGNRNNAEVTAGGGDVARPTKGNGAVGAIVGESHADA